MFNKGRCRVVTKLRTPFEILRTSTSNPPEIKLWRAVIIQALNDATSSARDSESINHTNAAKKWLRYLNNDFRSVCAFADVEHIYIFRHAKVLIRQHELKVHRRNTSKIKPKEKVRKLPNIVRSMM